MKAAILGAGVIGAGWAARFILHGWDVSVYDRDERAPQLVGRVIERAKSCLSELYSEPLKVGDLHIAASLDEAVEQTDWVQESLPERLELKQNLYAQLVNNIPDTVPIASSTSGFKPSDLGLGCDMARQLLVCHPFNPVYLLPMVEVVPHTLCSDVLLQFVMQNLAAVGMRPLRVKKEIDAHIADRLLEAVWREALWLIRDGVATTAEIDEVIKYGFGLRWAQMGLFETYRIGGGEAGMGYFLEQFGPALQLPWTKLMDVPDLTPALIQTITKQSDEQSGQYSIEQLERLRDDNLVAILGALKGRDWGAGQCF